MLKDMNSEEFGETIRFREYSFLENPRCPRKVCGRCTVLVFSILHLLLDAAKTHILRIGVVSGEVAHIQSDRNLHEPSSMLDSFNNSRFFAKELVVSSAFCLDQDNLVRYI